MEIFAIWKRKLCFFSSVFLKILKIEKKKFFSIFTQVHQHLLNSRETVSCFTAVSLKLTWNLKNGQSFTETGCQKYGVFGMKSANSTVSQKLLSVFFFFRVYRKKNRQCHKVSRETVLLADFMRKTAYFWHPVSVKL